MDHASDDNVGLAWMRQKLAAAVTAVALLLLRLLGVGWGGFMTDTVLSGSVPVEATTVQAPARSQDNAPGGTTAPLAPTTRPGDVGTETDIPSDLDIYLGQAEGPIRDLKDEEF